MGFGTEEGDERDLEKGMGSPMASARHDQQAFSFPATTPNLFVSSSGKALLLSHSRSGSLERALSVSSPRTNRNLNEMQPPLSPSSSNLVVSTSGKALLVLSSSRNLLNSNSSKRFDRKKYVKQVTGRYNDTELHLLVQLGDAEAVKQIMDEINGQMVGTSSGADFDAEVREIRSAIVNEVNELGETALFIAAEKGHLEVVKELFKYSTEEGIRLKNGSGFDALHIAASQGHGEIVQMLLEHDPSLSKTVAQSNTTPLISAAAKGHLGIVKELLKTDPSLLDLSRTNGKNALHLAARQGHFGIVRALLERDPQLARKPDKKGQTALHMAVKGVSVEVVKLLLNLDPTVVTIPDKYNNCPLHIAARKKRAEIVNELLNVRDTDVNALTRESKTALDIVEGLPLSNETADIKDFLIRNGAHRANEINQPRDELRQTVTEIKKDMNTQLEQVRKTNQNMYGIATQLKKFHRMGIITATNSVTIVASLYASVTFAAIFTLPGGDTESGAAVMADSLSFKIFMIFNALALFTSLAVVVVQITIVRGETKAERRVVEVINKLMWLATVATTVAFIASAYIIVGKENEWAGTLVSCTGGVVMTAVLITMTYFIYKYKRGRRARKKRKMNQKSGNSMVHHSDSDSDRYKPIYPI